MHLRRHTLSLSKQQGVLMVALYVPVSQTLYIETVIYLDGCMALRTELPLRLPCITSGRLNNTGLCSCI